MVLRIVVETTIGLGNKKEKNEFGKAEDIGYLALATGTVASTAALAPRPRLATTGDVVLVGAGDAAFCAGAGVGAVAALLRPPRVRVVASTGARDTAALVGAAALVRAVNAAIVEEQKEVEKNKSIYTEINGLKKKQKQKK